MKKLVVIIELRKKKPDKSLSCDFKQAAIIELNKKESGVNLSCEYLIYTIKSNLLYTQIIEICDRVISAGPITY